jgi:predicted dehydrogenase
MLKKCLIIGLGQIGMGYDIWQTGDEKIYTHARAFTLHPFFELVGAVDPSEEKRAMFEKVYQKPAFVIVSEALENLSPDIVVISVPTDKHYDLIKEILQHSKASVILCEKPLSFDLEEGRAIVNACEDKGVQLFVNFVRRSDTGVLEVHKRITNGQISTPVKGTSWYTKGFLHNGSHFFNLIEFWLGKMTHYKLLTQGRVFDSKYPEPDVYVEFEKGSIVFLAGREESFSYHDIELMSPSGRLRYESGGDHICWDGTKTDPNFPDHSILNRGSEIIPNGMERYQWHVTDQLAKVFLGEPTSICTGAEALLTLESMNKIINQR